MSKFLVNKYKALEPYTPGEQPRERKYLKLNTNESPFPPSEKAIALAAEEAKRLMLYFDPECKELSAKMAETLGVKTENVILTNGSDEVLNFAFMAYCDENTPAVFPDITYGFYKVFAAVNALPYKEIPLLSDFSMPTDALLLEKGTLFIANPNAPTGLLLPLSEIERLVASDPSRIVVVDEAYIDFGGESAVSLISKYDNLLVTGTFSKSRSMAGARLGFGVGSPALIADLHRIRYSTNPYNVNRMTAAAGIGALSDPEYFEENCKKIIEARAYAVEALASLGFTMTDSKANFLFARHEKIGGAELYAALREKGVLVRHFGAERIKDYNRITVGSMAEMQTLVKLIKEILEEKL